ncbi:MAG: NAD-dependent epimerase/dehydratase family protein [Myxococcota bacterium]|nr:NAD-dependent epimerase/dehydratase family protein [Myxococcota bacterium]
MRVLVTGGAGFVGSVTVAALRESGHDVVVLDDLSTGRADRVGDATLVVGDVRDKEIVRESMSDVQAIVHLAGRSSVWESFLDPLLCHSVNAWGTEVLLDAALRLGVQRVVLASSAAVYGVGGGRLSHEDDAPDPRSPYAASKVGMEATARVYGLQGLRVSVLRYFNVYGHPRVDDPSGGVVARFLSAFERGEAMPLEGTGLQGRDFVHVRDVARANVLALGGPVDTYTVGTGRLTTIRDLGLLIGAVSGRPVRFDTLPSRAGDVDRSVADISKIERRLGWSPRLTLEEGLRAGQGRAQSLVARVG